MSKEDEPSEKATITKACRMRVLNHSYFVNACSAYMIGNKFGQLIGGNRMEYILEKAQDRLCCPTRFNSHFEAEGFMRLRLDYMESIESICRLEMINVEV